MKRKFEASYNQSNWHCIVGKLHKLASNLVIGRDFGAYVTHETQRYIYFYIG